MKFNLNDYQGDFFIKMAGNGVAETAIWSSIDGTCIKQTPYIASIWVCIVMLYLPNGKNTTQYLNGAILWKTVKL